MADCPQCKSEISFWAAFTLGGKFECKSCHAVIYKKISNELLLIFSCIATAILAKFIVVALLADHYRSITNFQFFIYASVPAILVALLTLKIVWKYFVKL